MRIRGEGQGEGGDKEMGGGVMGRRGERGDREQFKTLGSTFCFKHETFNPIELYISKKRSH